MLAERYKQYPHVEIINAAVCVEPGPKTFYLSKMEGHIDNMASSSLFEVSEAYRKNGPRNQVHTKQVITVNGVNMMQFLSERGITHIDTYISDAEGFDFSILKTIQSLTDSKRIRTIQVETEPDYVQVEQRSGQPMNKSWMFLDLLIENYDLVGMQKGNYDWNSDTHWFNRDLEFCVKSDS